MSLRRRAVELRGRAPDRRSGRLLLQAGAPGTAARPRPALVRAGLLGKVVQERHEQYKATWRDSAGREQSNTFASEREATAEISRCASGGLRFHDLRHSYATWLVSDGVPVNDVQRVMGHEQATTTLNLYTHSSGGVSERVRNTFDAFRCLREIISLEATMNVRVGLSGLEPLTSSLSGKRSNRLSYRPGCTQRAE